MRSVKELLEYVTYKSVRGDITQDVTDVVCHSGKVFPGAVFVCIRGNRTDGHDYIMEAVQKGARVVVVEHSYVTFGRHGALILTECRKINLSELADRDGICVVTAEDTKKSLSELSAAFYDFPAGSLKMIGITGTSGKTTTMFLTAAILREAGYAVGMIGTGYYHNGCSDGETENTTPQSCEIHRLLSEMVKNQCSICVMEVSSQGIADRRVANICFDIGIFLNIEPDHIGKGEHATFAEYLYCKGKLMQQCQIGIVNRDDGHVFQILSGHTCRVETFSKMLPADWVAEEERCERDKGNLSEIFRVRGKSEAFEVRMPLPGTFNLYNALAAVAVAKHFQVENEQIQRALEKAEVPGRCQNLTAGRAFTVLIDYAHNAMELKNLLETLREFVPNRMIVLFGCGGNRSRIRRFQMGETAARLADYVILTTDNPRWEDPDAIMEQVEEGVLSVEGQMEGHTYRKVTDRREAVFFAVEMLKPGDILVIAGKGCEREQEIRGKRYPLDDRKLTEEALAGRAETN